MGIYLDRFRLSFVDPDPIPEFIAWDWERLRLEYEQELNQIELITDTPTPVHKTIPMGRSKQIGRTKRYKRQESNGTKLRKLTLKFSLVRTKNRL